jgi:hypothetical protein
MRKENELQAALKRQIHDVCRVAHLAGLSMDEICETLEHVAWFADYIARCGSRVYPKIVAEPCDA